jgi:hypothetical protein
MIKTIVLTGAVAGVLAVNVTDTYEFTRNTVLRIVDTYVAAANINPYEDKQTFQKANARLFATSRGLQPAADTAYKFRFKDNTYSTQEVRFAPREL